MNVDLKRGRVVQNRRTIVAFSLDSDPQISEATIYDFSLMPDIPDRQEFGRKSLQALEQTLYNKGTRKIFVGDVAYDAMGFWRKMGYHQVSPLASTWVKIFR